MSLPRSILWMAALPLLGCGVPDSAPRPGATDPLLQPAATSRAEPPRPPALRPAPPSLNVDPEAIDRRLYESVKFLASDELQGRGIRTAGIERAAQYLAEQYRQIGLQADAFSGTPFQTFNFGTRIVIQDSLLKLSWPEGDVALGPDDFAPIAMSRSGSFALPLAFVGYGITAPELNYDDYDGVDVRGKAVIVLRHEPRKDDPDSPFNGRQNSEHAYLDSKIKNAVRHGAAAVLFCTDRAALRTPRGGAGAATVERLLDFSARRGSAQGVPALHCRRPLADRALQACLSTTLDELERQINDQLRPRSAVLPGGQVGGSLTIRRRGRPQKNVIGVLEGSGPLRDETIIVGAHYDHLGLGGSGSLASWTVDVHNGADDNASGTAVMLEVARQLAARGPLRRRVLFIAFTAEESGLVGSERYARTPLVPLEQTVAMLNLDMVGRLRERLEVHGVGTAAEFSPMLDELAPARQLRIRKIPDGYGPSDHATFYERGVPVLHFFTGLHRDYHRPSDDYDKLNIAGMRQIALLTADVAAAIAQADQAPQRRTTSYEDLLGLGDESSPQRGAKLGIQLADGDDGEVRIMRVLPRSPAEAAGLRAGDVVLQLDGQAVASRSELIETVRQQPSGHPLRLQVRRGATRLEFEAKLGP